MATDGAIVYGGMAPGLMGYRLHAWKPAVMCSVLMDVFQSLCKRDGNPYLVTVAAICQCLILHEF